MNDINIDDLHLTFFERIERCKREDSKEQIIICLDKATIKNNEQIKSDFIGAFEIVGCLILILIFILWIMQKLFLK